MKRIIKPFLLIFGLIICVNVCAKTSYNNTPTIVNDYIKKFRNYQRYIVTEPVYYGFNSGNISNNSKYKTGGLLNKEEFIISKSSSGDTYLFNGLEYFTMTEENGNIVIIDPENYNYFSSKNQSYSSGIRATNYVQNGVTVTGKGTKIDPWMFKEKHFVRYDFDNNAIDIIPSTKNVNANESIISNVIISNGYEYVNNDCGAVYSNGMLTLSGINNDIVCIVNTKYATYTIALDSKNATTTGTTNIYETFNTGYYLDSDSINQMTTSTNAINLPTKTGYIFNGYYTEENGNGTMYIDENGKITSNASVTNFIDDGRLYAKWTANCSAGHTPLDDGRCEYTPTKIKTIYCYQSAYITGYSGTCTCYFNASDINEGGGSANCGSFSNCNDACRVALGTAKATGTGTCTAVYNCTNPSNGYCFVNYSDGRTSCPSGWSLNTGYHNGYDYECDDGTNPVDGKCYYTP